MEKTGIESAMEREALKKFKAEDITNKLTKAWGMLDKDDLSDVIYFKDGIMSNITSWKMMGISDDKLDGLIDLYADIVIRMTELIQK